MEVLVCENRCFPFTELLTGWDRKTLPHHKTYTMTETKVYKLHESKQVEDIATMLKIEGIKVSSINSIYPLVSDSRTL